MEEGLEGKSSGIGAGRHQGSKSRAHAQEDSPVDRTLRRWANQGSRVRGEKESRDRQRGKRRVPLSDVKVSKTSPLRECAEL